MPWIPDVSPNELIESQWGNTIRDHAVNVLASIADRAAAIPTPAEGMVTYLTDSNKFEVWSGTAWIPFETNITAGAGNVVPCRIRAETVVATTDANGNVATVLAPPLGDLVSIVATPGDIQVPFHVLPYRNQFTAGATTVTWSFRSPTDAPIVSTTIRFDYMIVDYLL